MEKLCKDMAKKILKQYLYEPPSITERQKRQLNEGGEIKKSIKANGYQVELRITFQGLQVKVFKGAALCAESASQRPYG
ncbi:MAG: hypothetical protein AUJ32_00575 [Parcubacteria group bacterium CG1_02_40_82]|uniref:Uncharacterized protein n=4 Tax=Candidatus Portnoyibacteriota TaxID=1817913 RepID=A0A2M7IIR6_9BACT|nr:MAG: hypothetical protein AUJ32_00575 [Parcubacteria group bacterium CG1_02_40_82]PIQ75281.1 MAG: hypothetical protein COV84_02025 [Candidatus Portnoybacteria bacterium CG11_big_fil_rev_8_21_14_0_20_40_15]PIS30633.1 MAG: hypothetical protein COT41_03055 [Candidatus Portnoybacteria bacterium CG08_land_8_20_14_0_20_40_83]PIW76371.1 MAG: hypothetical protein CO001_01700 [Candidatus Portnoybacteria bacterium CG_4_8_14_3_um_filter_40_10]PIY74826.1 MAG: hypothetical protein COY85_02145 [Candidatus